MGVALASKETIADLYYSGTRPFTGINMKRVFTESVDLGILNLLFW